MANSSLFDELILSFDDANDLRERANEFGHLDEPIVQEHIAFIRNRSESMDTNMDIGSHLKSANQVKVRILFIYYYIFSYFQVSNILL